MKNFFRGAGSSSIILMVSVHLFFTTAASQRVDSAKVTSTSKTRNGSHWNVSILPFEIAENDSIFTAARQRILDATLAFLASPQFSNPNVKILNEVSIEEIASASEASLKKWAKKNQSDLLIAGRLESNDNQAVLFHPILFISESLPSDKRSHAIENSLTGKTCRLNPIHLPSVSIDALQPFFDFLAAFYFASHQQFDAAIKIFKVDSASCASRFYLAERYLQRGMAHEKNLASARKDWDSSLVSLKFCALHAESRLDRSRIHNNSGVALQLSGKLDSAIVYFSRAKAELNDTVPHRERIRILNNLANSYLLGGQWKQALDVFQANLEEVKASHDSTILAETYENLGDIYQLIMQRNKAVEYYDAALELRKRMNDEPGMAICLQLIGNVYLGKNEHEKAKQYFKESLAINLKLQNEPRIADSYDLIGQVFQDSGPADSALMYYQKSMDNYELLGDAIGYLRSLLHQASVHQKEKNFDEALAIYQKALDRTSRQNSRSMRAQIYDRLGDIYNSRDDLVAAYDYYKQSIDLYEELQNYESLSLILFNMGLIHLKNNEYGEGYQILKRAIEMDKEHGFNNLVNEKDFLQEVHDLLDKN